MRVRRWISAVAMTAALLGTLASVAPVTATTPIKGKTVYWRVDRAGVKGLVTATEIPPTGLMLMFTLWGLRANGNYGLAGFAETCAAAPSSSLFLRDLTANARGFSWDPVVVAGSVSLIRSLRLRDLDSGTDVLCENTSRFGTGPSDFVGVVKIKAAGGVRGIGVIDESAVRRVVMAVGGLRAGTEHAIVIRSVGCVSGGRVLNRWRFTPNGQGRALVDRVVWEPAAARETPSGTGSVDLNAGSLRIKRGTTGVSCSVPANRVS